MRHKYVGLSVSYSSSPIPSSSLSQQRISLPTATGVVMKRIAHSRQRLISGMVPPISCKAQMGRPKRFMTIRSSPKCIRWKRSIRPILLRFVYQIRAGQSLPGLLQANFPLNSKNSGAATPPKPLYLPIIIGLTMGAASLMNSINNQPPTILSIPTCPNTSLIHVQDSRVNRPRPLVAIRVLRIPPATLFGNSYSESAASSPSATSCSSTKKTHNPRQIIRRGREIQFPSYRI